MVSWKLADVPALVGALGFSRVDRLQTRGSGAGPGWLPAERRSCSLRAWGALSWRQRDAMRLCGVSECCCASQGGGCFNSTRHSPETD